MVTGIGVARSVMAALADDVAEELVPGRDVQTRQQLRTFVRDNAWGHHASCTCAIGAASDPRAVVGSDFRVHGTQGLRVVDASVFPRIPGFFIVTAIYMVAEKASAAILADATAAAGPAPPAPISGRSSPDCPTPASPPARTPPRRSDEHRDPRSDEHRRVPADAAHGPRRPPPSARGAVSAAGSRERLPAHAVLAHLRLDRADHRPSPRLGQAAAARRAGRADRLRTILRQKNLYDPSTAVPIVNAEPVPERTPEHLVARSVDGTYNDLDHPDMGRAGARFGRNIPLDQVLPVTSAELMEPSPREVSRRLLTRDPFLPATSVNTLAASWLQFMIHDWFTHGEGDTSRLVDIPLQPGDPWWENPMRIPRIKLDPTRPAAADGPVTTVNDVTHWWDGSSLYGSSREEQQRLRTGEGGRLRLTDDGQLPVPDDPALDPTMKPGWWTGLGMWLTLFAREHNAVCARLASDYPTWDDEELFQRGRLVVAALLAKIHTVEWTPAIISHPTTVYALRANWFGVAGERIARTFGRISGSEVISGIPGAATEHYGVPFSLTEEFTAVYRMHPLLPDDFDLRSAAADAPLGTVGFRALAGPHSKEIAARYALGDLFYSFGTTHPGAIVLRNYPKFLQEYERPDGKRIDLAATDLVRIREVGVPRYCEFRRQMHLEGAGLVHGAHGRRGPGAGDGRSLRRHREGRPDGGPVRREAADRLRVQRHRVPHLRADGLATAQQRPVLHPRLPAGDLLADRADLGAGQRHAHRPAAALPRAAPGPARVGQRLHPLDHDIVILRITPRPGAVPYLH